MAEPPKPAEEESPRISAEGVDDYDWLRLPAVYCDTYSSAVFRRAGVVRIAFGEYVGRNYMPFYRSCVAMPISDAKMLVRTLTRQITRAEERNRADRERAADRLAEIADDHLEDGLDQPSEE
jgi:hypothetical protein